MSESNKQALTIGVILAVLVGILLGYVYYMYVGPDLVVEKGRQVKLEDTIKTDKAELRRMEDFINDKASRDKLTAVVEEAKQRLPSDEKAIEFFDLLRDCLARTNVTQTRIAPMGAVKRPSYYEIPYEIVGSARYHEFGQFVNMIECNPRRFMRLSKMELSTSSERPSIHPLSLTVSTFQFSRN